MCPGRKIKVEGENKKKVHLDCKSGHLFLNLRFRHINTKCGSEVLDGVGVKDIDISLLSLT